LAGRIAATSAAPISITAAANRMYRILLLAILDLFASLPFDAGA
jgi:hypothetical protein